MASPRSAARPRPARGRRRPPTLLGTNELISARFGFPAAIATNAPITPCAMPPPVPPANVAVTLSQAPTKTSDEACPGESTRVMEVGRQPIIVHVADVPTGAKASSSTNEAASTTAAPPPQPTPWRRTGDATNSGRSTRRRVAVPLGVARTSWPRACRGINICACRPVSHTSTHVLMPAARGSVTTTR